MSNNHIDVVHGDIKPQNVLVFKDATTSKTTVRMSDFGYSTVTAGAFGRVLLLKLRLWNAPEHHFGESTPCEGRMSFHLECFVFGLCLATTYRILHQGIQKAGRGFHLTHQLGHSVLKRLKI